MNAFIIVFRRACNNLLILGLMLAPMTVVVVLASEALIAIRYGAGIG